MFYRLTKPNWAKKKLSNGNDNPDFLEELSGPDVIEGCLSEEEVTDLNEFGYNSYFFPNHPSTNVYENEVRHLSGKHIDTFNCIFLDMDLKDQIYASKEAFLEELKGFELAPSLVVDSGNGIHAYWYMSDLTRETYIRAQFGLITRFKTDPSIWTVLQLMRVPGSLNTKRHKDYKRSETVDHLSTLQTYSINDIPAHLWEIAPELEIKAQNHLNRLDGKTEVQIHLEVDSGELPENFIALINKDPKIKDLFEDPVGSYGDRSGADMKLANLLFSKKIPKKDALKVLANTQKALSKINHRFEYAQATIDKAYVDRTKNKFQTVSQKLKSGMDYKLGKVVNGPFFMDYGVLNNPWQKSRIMGIIAGSGIGKTTITLNVFKHMIENNLQNNDDIYVFISLEMPDREVIEAWIDLVGENSPLTDRLYVIANEDVNGEPRNIGLQEIYEYCSDIKISTGKEIGALAIDHFGVLSSHIDIRKKPNFGINNESTLGWGDIKNLSKNMLATQIKALTKMLDTFTIVLTQTTKEKGQGDVPIDKDGAYGISEYENIMDYIITAWQPLMRVQDKSPYYYLAWQYVKIRHKHSLDKIKTHQQKLLTFDMKTKRLNPTSQEEYQLFQELLPMAIKAREELAKKKSTEYSRCVDMSELKKMTANLSIVKN